MVRKPVQTQTTRGKGYKTTGLTEAKWKKPAHPAEDSSSRPASQNRNKKGLSRLRAEKDSSIPAIESKKII